MHSQYVQGKKTNEKLAQSLRRIGDKHWGQVAKCARHIELNWCPQCGKAHANVVWCCRHRLCPICALRRSRKTGGQALEAFEYMKKHRLLDGTKMYLLTLTQRNVSGEELRDEVGNLLKALDKIRRQSATKRYVVGSARNIEITYNSRAHTYHPHVHMILILRDDMPSCMTEDKYWRDVWHDLMGLDYEPICDIRPINDESGAICEVSKYAVKPNSIFALDLQEFEMDRAVKTIDDALRNRRLATYTGIWKQARAALKQADVDEDLEHDDLRDVCGCGAELLKAVLEWDGLTYVPVEAE